MAEENYPEYDYPYIEKQEEERRNILNRYCRKVDYYVQEGHSREDAQKKAKEFYKIK